MYVLILHLRDQLQEGRARFDAKHRCRMKTRAKRRVTARFTRDRLKVSFWFAPLVMSLGAILLAWAMYGVDTHIPNEMLQNSRLVLSGSVDELRGFLFTMATTILATAGVVFTLLTLPLSTVAAQYGSRLLRVFLGDRTTQLVLGMFVGTFVYCIAAATSLPPVGVQPEGPQVTTTIGLLLMLATFASLILLIQHSRVRGRVLIVQEHQPLPSEQMLARFRAHCSPRATTFIS